jgi:hypothetical protein
MSAFFKLTQLDEIDKQRERLEEVRRKRRDKRKQSTPIDHEERRTGDRRVRLRNGNADDKK